MKSNDLKSLVKEKYGKIAQQSEGDQPLSCCGPSSTCCDTDYTIFSENYEDLQGYNPEADLGLGCGLPTEFAGLKPGQHVLDLGSGAGNDCFVARAIAGETGKVTGLDFSDEMLEKARRNADKLGFTNVDFVSGDIEAMPFDDNQFDVIISNCVLNLVPDKHRAFEEIMRVLKSGGHLSVSDIVLTRPLPEKIKYAAEMYAGCVSGAIQKSDYLDAMKNKGFENIQIMKEKQVVIPDNILGQYLDQKEIEAYRKDGHPVVSITVNAEKP